MFPIYKRRVGGYLDPHCHYLPHCAQLIHLLAKPCIAAILIGNLTI